MEQNNGASQIGLNIHILSFSINNASLKNHDDIRVSFTTFPGHAKEHFCVKAKKINSTNHVFSLNISNETKSILLVFRRKNFLLNDPIIGCLIINTCELPNIPKDFDSMSSFSKSSEIKTMKIYEPIFRKPGDNSPKEKPKVNGQIDIQFTITEPYAIKEHKMKHQKENNHNNYKISKNNNETDNNKKMNKKVKHNNDYIFIE